MGKVVLIPLIRMVFSDKPGMSHPLAAVFCDKPVTKGDGSLSSRTKRLLHLSESLRIKTKELRHVTQ